jgi:hypothetical protein
MISFNLGGCILYRTWIEWTHTTRLKAITMKSSLQEIIHKAYIIRNQLIDKGQYTLGEVRYLIDIAETEDDGLESDRTRALYVLRDMLQNNTN